MFITGLIAYQSKSSKYKQILEQLEIYIYKTHQNKEQSKYEYISLFLHWWSFISIDGSNKTLHLCDTHVSVSLSGYVTLQIFSYYNLYPFIYTSISTDYLKSYHINEKPHRCNSQRARLGCDISWVRSLVHINEEPPFVAPFVDILGNYYARYKTIFLPNIAQEIEMTYFSGGVQLSPFYWWVIRRV